MSTVGSGNRLTYSEVHAAILGTVVGALVAFGYARGFRLVAVAAATFFVGLALGFDLRARAEPAAAERVLQREPWYALGAFLVAGAGVFLVL